VIIVALNADAAAMMASAFIIAGLKGAGHAAIR
jgi:hypothetical protein